MKISNTYEVQGLPSLCGSESGLPGVVLKSPVRSGFLPFLALTETETG